MHVSVRESSELLSQFLPTRPRERALSAEAAADATREAPHRVLILESNASLASLLKTGLSAESLGVEVTDCIAAVMERISVDTYEVLILDLDLPGVDGAALLEGVRTSRPDLRVLALSGRSSVDHLVMALDCGADDYLFKPFSLLELTARVRALRRRAYVQAPARPNGNKLTLNRDQCRVERDGRQIDLTPREFALLDVMVQNAGKTLSRSMLTREVWNMPAESSTNIVDVYMKYLRDKIDGEHEDKLIRTVRGLGYILQVQ